MCGRFVVAAGYVTLAGGGVGTPYLVSGLPSFMCLADKLYLVPESKVSRIGLDWPWPQFGIPCRH